MKAPIRVETEARLVECLIGQEGPGTRYETPWGMIELGEETGAGLRITVEASEDFDLLLHRGATSLFEHLSPGRRRLLLTHLDRTDVVSE